MDYSSDVSHKLRQVLNSYINCLELYCNSVKSKQKNPVKILVVTKRLIEINKQIQAIAKEINEMKKRC